MLEWRKEHKKFIWDTNLDGGAYTPNLGYRSLKEEEDKRKRPLWTSKIYNIVRPGKSIRKK